MIEQAKLQQDEERTEDFPDLLTLNT
jgi:hypothetical protein